MTTPPPPPQRPGLRGYVIAAALVVTAVAIGAVIAVVIVRALVGYTITPFEAGQSTSVTIADRDIAIWVTPESTWASCGALENGTSISSLKSVNATLSITDGGRTWKRVAIVRGEPGSTHDVTCSSTYGNEQFGYADNPRVARYVIVGVASGVAAGLLVITAFIIALMTGLRRSKRPSDRTAR